MCLEAGLRAEMGVFWRLFGDGFGVKKKNGGWFGLGLRVLQFSWYCKDWNRFLRDICGKSGELRNGCC